MNSFLRGIFTLLVVFTYSETSFSETVKYTNSGICHESRSAYYSRIKNYIPYESLSECLKAGGRMPLLPGGSEMVSENTSEYSREKFGHGWADTDGDCQNTRAEILIKTSTSTIQYKDLDNCSVVRGRWISPFTSRIYFEASKLDVDHLVPLKWAWDRGASAWSQTKREAFANDPRNLLVVEASLNRSKGAKGVDMWLPPKNKCQYAARFVRVALEYELELPQHYPDIVGTHCSKG
ncbi:MAG: HNH endonuclease [Oceanospirillaceae bacterium]|nr:HNH endonuclease [Oceanospirillaceae bacterium]